METSDTNTTEPIRIDRRAAIKWMMGATAGAMLLDKRTLAETAATSGEKGYGTDPDLLKTYHPGDLWPLTFTDSQRRTAASLCDVIIPADEHSPGAASLGVQDFIDEWISAPYAEHKGDRKTILEGLAWIEAESQKRFGNEFSNTIHGQKAAICDDICLESAAKPEFKAGAKFFKRFRDLTAGGFYTTPEGMKDLNYIGNVPLASFEGPSPELLKKLGIE